MLKLDLKDKKILYELDLNARQSNNQIAKKVGLSKDVVNYRIKRMEEEGIIKYFVTVIDTTKLGYTWNRFYVKFWGLSPKIEEEITSFLKTRVAWIVKVRGNWDLNFLFWAQTTEELREFWEEFYANYGNYVQKSWFSVMTRIIHYPRSMLLDKEPKNSFILGEKSSKIKIDAIDYKILGFLANNARAQNIDIAKALHTTEIVIRYRIKKLVESKVILNFRPFLDINLLGYKYYKIHFYLKDVTRELYSRIKRFVGSKSVITYVDEVIGGADLEIEANVLDNDRLYNLIDEIRKEFPDKIKDVEFLEYIKEYTLRYVPDIEIANK